MGSSWLLNVFLASLLLSLTVHVTFQLGVASHWQQADPSSGSGPRGLANDPNNSKNSPRHPNVIVVKSGVRGRSGLLLEAVVAKAVAAATAREAVLETDEAEAAAAGERSTTAPIPTLDCESLLREARENRLEFRDPNTGTDPATYQRQTLPISPGDDPFWISLHVPAFDPVRWNIMKTGAYYERTLETIWRQVLKKSPPHSRVLDVGANIGYFTLVSMAAATTKDVIVDAFEPNPVNLLRTCESLVLNNWNRLTTDNNHKDDASSWSLPGVHLHPVGVSDTNEVLPFVTNRINPGQSQFVSSLPEAISLVKNSKGEFQHGPDKSVITLDAFATSRGWIGPWAMEPRPHIAVLKVDVEALEHKVIVGATQLLQSHLVHNVFMEVSARNDNEVENGQLAIQVLIDAGYKLQGYGGFSGPGTSVTWPQDDPSRLVSRILDEARKLPVKQLNLWWTI
jgi:Methyltransferase FkbM domain